MPLDVHSLQSFYGSPLGEVARRLVGRVIRARWERLPAFPSRPLVMERPSSNDSATRLVDAWP